MKIINEYKQGFRLGGGMNSKCYILTKDRKTYCMKKIKVKKEDVKRIDKVEKEIEIMKLLECHKNIIKLEEVFRMEKGDCFIFCIVTEALRMNLAQYLKSKKRGYLKEKTCKKIFKQLMEVVEFLHLNYICHHDIKLENIMIDPETLNIKLIDFGMSTMGSKEEDISKMNEMSGTPMYISPEKFSFDEYDGRKSDIWSCGILLYKLATGSFPFEQDNLLDLSRSIKDDSYDIPHSNISESFTSLIFHLLHKNPSKRIDSSDTLQHEWFQCNKNRKLSCSAMHILTMESFSNHYNKNFFFSSPSSF